MDEVRGHGLEATEKDFTVVQFNSVTFVVYFIKQASFQKYQNRWRAGSGAIGCYDPLCLIQDLITSNRMRPCDLSMALRLCLRRVTLPET